MAGERGFLQTAFGETKVFASTNSPLGILRAIQKTAEYHGSKLNESDIAALEEQFAHIDEKLFRRVLNSIEFLPLQLLLIEAMERVPTGSTMQPRDVGTQFGNAA
ncbi:hypothetical protein WOC76_06980 [Methylocystis sp. IM3]|uniref:hypothetical protein n=1 Tax=unclassified Methylocystis TaxID=2625913 RepID=UPI0030F86BDB